MLKLVCFAFLVIGCACLPEYERDFSMEEYNTIQPPSNLDDNSIAIPEWFYFPGISRIQDLDSWVFRLKIVINGVSFNGVFQHLGATRTIFYTSEGPFTVEMIKLYDQGQSTHEPRLFVKFISVPSRTRTNRKRLTVISRAYAPPSEVDDNADARANAVFVSLPSNHNNGQLTTFDIQWISQLLRGGMNPKCLGPPTIQDNVETTSYVGVPVVVNFF